MKNVLVFGGGRRVLGAVLPALWCLRDRFRITGIVTRTVKPISIACGAFSTKTLSSVASIDLSTIDLVIVAVTTEQVPVVLRQLARQPMKQAVLMLDTPVLRLTGLRATRMFPAFKRVLATEDNIALPPFLIARRLIDEGAIGELRQIYFFHNGYKHHALASLKMLTRSEICRIVDRKYRGRIRQKQIEFENGVSAVMYEPRDYANGKFLIRGECGAIADYDYAVPPVWRIGYQVDGSIYRGLTLNGVQVRPSGLDQLYLEGVHSDVHDGSLMNTLKLRGLMDLLDEALAASSPFHYDPIEAICDNFNIRVANRVGFVPPRLIARTVSFAVRASQTHHAERPKALLSEKRVTSSFI